MFRRTRPSHPCSCQAVVTLGLSSERPTCPLTGNLGQAIARPFGCYVSLVSVVGQSLLLQINFGDKLDVILNTYMLHFRLNLPTH